MPAPTSSAARVALLGFGNVGRAVAKILIENPDKGLRLTHICNRNFLEPHRQFSKQHPMRSALSQM